MSRHLLVLLSFLVTPFVLSLGLVATPAQAWSNGGHQVIGHLATERLHPEARAEAERLLAALAELEPRSRTIPRASSWLDQVRHGGLRAFDEWHWVNLPYEPEGGGLAPETPPGELLRVTRQAIDVLENPDSELFARAFMLRVLLHTVGDAHQPLHCVARYTPEHPDGDRGGNLFVVVDPGNQWENLHFYWDYGLGLLPQVGGPLDEETVARLADEIGGGDLSDDLARRAEILEPKAWCEEGRELAMTVVYAGIEEGKDPSAEYVETGQRHVRQRLRLAAERLARILNHALAPPGPKTGTPTTGTPKTGAPTTPAGGG